VDDDDCGGSFLSDNQNDSKVIGTAGVEVDGRHSDPRTPRDIVRAMMTRLQRLGWHLRPADHDDPDEKSGTTRVLTKAGVPGGRAKITARHFKLASGTIVPVASIDIITDCLRNPYHKN
jgi:hypothetical protein